MCTGSRLYSKSFSVLRVVLQPVGTQCLLRGGVFVKYRVTQVAALLLFSIASIRVFVQLE